MLYDEARMALTKERLEDLRKEKSCPLNSFPRSRGAWCQHQPYKSQNYEINDPVHPLYGRTRSMGIEYLVAFADFYDVSVEYLLVCLIPANRNITIFLNSWACAIGQLMSLFSVKKTPAARKGNNYMFHKIRPSSMIF